jgi:hypothetical protein
VNGSDVRLLYSVISLASAPNVSSIIASLLLRILVVHRLFLSCSFFLLQCTDKNWANLARDLVLVELSTLAIAGISPSKGLYCTPFVHVFCLLSLKVPSVVTCICELHLVGNFSSSLSYFVRCVLFK